MPDEAVLAMLSQMQSTRFTGWNQPPFPNFGVQIPGMNAGTNQLLNMALVPLLSQFVGPEFAALQLGGMTNLNDTLMARNMFQQRMDAMQLASVRDASTMRDMIGGAARMMGVNTQPFMGFETPESAAAGRLASTFGSMFPIMAQMMPETADHMMGIRGSATVMAQNMFQAGTVAFDPFSNRFGMSGKNVGFLTQELFNRFYGPGKDVTEMKGIGAGDVGGLFDEMTRRGFMGSGARAGEPGGGPQELGRIGDRLKSMVGVVSAMRDIFGDLGKPDAPMRELINGLQALTQGGLASMNPGQLEQTVRNMHQLGRASGLGIGGMLQLTAQGAGLADQFGVNRQFAVQAAQGSAAFAHAFGVSSLAGITGFGVWDKDTVLAKDMQLRMAGTASAASNQMGAAMALSESASFNKNSALGRYIEDIKAGRAKPVNEAEFLTMARDAGIRDESVRSQLFNTPGNQFFVNKFGIQETVRAAQLGEIKARVNMLGGLPGVNNFGDVLLSLSADELDDPTKAVNKLKQLLPGQSEDAIRQAFNLVQAQTRQGGSLEFYQGNLGNVRRMFDPEVFRLQGQFTETVKRRGEMASAFAGLGRGGILRNIADLMINENGQVTPADISRFVGGLAGGVPLPQLEDALNKFAPEMKDLVKEYTTLGIGADADKRREQIRNRLMNISGQMVPLTDMLNDVSLKSLESSELGKKRLAERLEKAGVSGDILPALMGLTGGRVSKIYEAEQALSRLKSGSVGSLGNIMEDLNIADMLLKNKDIKDVVGAVGGPDKDAAKNPWGKDNPLPVIVMNNDNNKSPGNRRFSAAGGDL